MPHASCLSSEVVGSNYPLCTTSNVLEEREKRKKCLIYWPPTFLPAAQGQHTHSARTNFMLYFCVFLLLKGWLYDNSPEVFEISWFLLDLKFLGIKFLIFDPSFNMWGKFLILVWHHNNDFFSLDSWPDLEKPILLSSAILNLTLKCQLIKCSM